jgi:simple sugar transport system substrate-binding protein
VKRFEIGRRGVLAGGAAGLALGGTSRARAAGPMKIAFVYTGPIGDLGYSYEQEQSRLALNAALGGAVSTSYVENVAEGPDCERVLRDLASAGNEMIFSTSFGFMNSAVRVAKQFPHVKFEQATGYKTAPNVAEYNIRWYEARAVCGTIAGHVSKTGVCGYVASFPIPEVVMGVNAFTIAAQKINPQFKVRMIFVNSWFDPGKEADAAKSLLDQGADILAQHTDSPAVMQTAQARGMHAFGQSSDMARFGPTAQLTSIVDHWSPYVIKRVKEALAGTWKSDDVWWGFKEDLVELAPYGPAVTPPVRQAADAVKAGIVSGALHPFAGPVKDQSGKVRIADGSHPSDDDLQKMDWYVEGVAS